MASVHGGHFQLSTGNRQINIAQSLRGAGRLSLASIAEAHTTIPGAGSGDTVGGGVGAGRIGIDTVSGPHQVGGAGFAGKIDGGTEQVVATQISQGGNTVLHLHDGSTITLVGTTHVDASFFH
jgi:hypothetical protein